MKKSWRLLRWIILNGLAAWCVWHGLFHNVEWAQNLLKFLVVFNFCITTATYIGYILKPDIRNRVHELGMPVPVTVSLVYDIAFAGTLAAMGLPAYSALAITQGFLYVGLHSNGAR